MKTRKDKGKARVNARRERAAVVFALREQGRSFRAIAEETGVSPGQVARILQGDPIRHETIEARLRASQASEYEEMGSLAREGTIAWLKEGNAVAKGGIGKIKTSTLGKLAVLPKLVSAWARTAQAATTSSQLLTGRATERLEHGKAAEDLSRDPDALIEQAIELGMVDRLPPTLRIEAERRVRAKALPAPGATSHA